MTHQRAALLRAEQERGDTILDADYTPIVDKQERDQRAREYIRRVRRVRAGERSRGMQRTERLLFCSMVIFSVAAVIALLWG